MAVVLALAALAFGIVALCSAVRSLVLLRRLQHRLRLFGDDMPTLKPRLLEWWRLDNVNWDNRDAITRRYRETLLEAGERAVSPPYPRREDR